MKAAIPNQAPTEVLNNLNASVNHAVPRLAATRRYLTSLLFVLFSFKLFKLCLTQCRSGFLFSYRTFINQ